MASCISEVFDHILQHEKHMFSVGMRTAAQNLVKWYFLKLAPVYSMKIRFKSDEFIFSVYSVFFWPINNENSQFSAEKDTKVSILKFTLALTFYIVYSLLRGKGNA